MKYNQLSFIAQKLSVYHHGTSVLKPWNYKFLTVKLRFPTMKLRFLTMKQTVSCRETNCFIC